MFFEVCVHLNNYVLNWSHFTLRNTRRSFVLLRIYQVQLKKLYVEIKNYFKTYKVRMYNGKNYIFSEKKLSFVEFDVFYLIKYFNSEHTTNFKRSDKWSSFWIQNKNIFFRIFKWILMKIEKKSRQG